MNRFTLDFEKPIRELEEKINELEQLASDGQIGIQGEIKKLRTKSEKLRTEIYSQLTRWQCVQLARHPHRPYTLDYLKLISPDFVELHGDRLFRDDLAIVSGLGRWKGRPVAIIGQQKGRGTRDNLLRNFGMPHPEGYRKAMRIMRLAEKFGIPVVTLIDTPGAYPGLGAEERGQASAIAENLYMMAELKVPTVAVVIGEGGSGGALALGVADRVYMLQYSIYSVISPEGCASILYREASKAQLAADALRLTARDLKGYNLIDDIIPEPIGGAHTNPEQTAHAIEETVEKALQDLIPLDTDSRIEQRIDKYARMGVWTEK
jgi:acetyl-CoA carboxylase carboxyl transferase subunit alpha